MTIQLRKFSAEDRPSLAGLLSRIKEFTPLDQALALELADVFLNVPDQKDYDFVLAVTEDDRVIGYACFGPTPLTEGTYDLYWIAVDPAYAGHGLGSRLLKWVEEKAISNNGRLLVIETSSSPHYAATRQFYLKNGYYLAETLKDFFRVGEDRLTYLKYFSRS
jgi:GNAT superfamily N-acetyltransferase